MHKHTSPAKYSLRLQQMYLCEQGPRIRPYTLCICLSIWLRIQYHILRAWEVSLVGGELLHQSIERKCLKNTLSGQETERSNQLKLIPDSTSRICERQICSWSFLLGKKYHKSRQHPCKLPGTSPLVRNADMPQDKSYSAGTTSAHLHPELSRHQMWCLEWCSR